MKPSTIEALRPVLHQLLDILISDFTQDTPQVEAPKVEASKVEAPAITIPQMSLDHTKEAPEEPESRPRAGRKIRTAQVNTPSALTQADLQMLCARLAQKTLDKNEIVQIIKKYGDRLSDVHPTEYNNLHKDLLAAEASKNG